MDRKARGVIAYLFGWIGGLIVGWGMKDSDRKTVFHACQSITISVINIAASFVLSFAFGMMAAFIGIDLSFLSSIVSILMLVLMIMGLVKAVRDDADPKLPVVGDLTEKMFANKINSAPDTGAVGVTPKFDPNTGQPINPQPQAKFDPNTGQPITQPQANFDPNTGKPLNESTPTENNDNNETI